MRACTNGIAPVSDVWKNFANGILCGSLRKALCDAALALSEALAETREGVLAFNVEGKAGETQQAEVAAYGWFQPEKLVVFEIPADGKVALDENTSILTEAWAGPKLQFNGGVGIHCAAFGMKVSGNCFDWDVVRPGRKVVLRFRFMQDCKVYAQLYGRGVRE